jgi:hypothetical protein
MQEEASPDEYFCEECRKDLHKVMTSSKGCVFLLNILTNLAHACVPQATFRNPRRLANTFLQSEIFPLHPRLRFATRQRPEIVRIERHRDTIW